MQKFIDNPVTVLRAYAQNTIKKHIQHDGITMDPTSGVMYMPQGAARLYINNQDHSIGLFFSKDSYNLEGDPTDEKLSHCYHIADYELQGQANNIKNLTNYPAIKHDIKSNILQHLAKHKDRMPKHFTLYGTKIDKLDPKLARQGLTPNTTTYIFTNNNYIYTIDKLPSGQWKVNFAMPTRRKDGSFVPIDLSRQGLRDIFAKSSTTLAVCETLDEAMDTMDAHWAKVSSNIWDEGDAYDVAGKLFKYKAKIKERTNKIIDSIPRRAFTAASTGTMMGLTYYGGAMSAAVASTAYHTAYDLVTDEMIEGRKIRLKQSQKRKLSDYKIGENRTDFYRKKTAQEVSKLCAHIDPKRLPASHVEWPTFDTANLYSNDMTKGKYNKAGSLEELVLYLQQRGLSSRCDFPNDTDIIQSFQNGINRISLYDQHTETYTIFAQHLPQRCKNEKVALPEYYAEKFNGDNVISYRYKANPDTFEEGIISDIKQLTPQEAVDTLTYNLTQRSAHQDPDLLKEINDYLIMLMDKSQKPPPPLSIKHVELAHSRDLRKIAILPIPTMTWTETTHRQAMEKNMKVMEQNLIEELKQTHPYALALGNNLGRNHREPNTPTVG